jgi:hypothetical protein
MFVVFKVSLNLVLQHVFVTGESTTQWSIEKDVTIVLKMVKKWIEQSFALECRSLASDIIYGLSFQMPN